MEIPSKVKIGYQNYNVNIIDGNLVDDNKVCYGNIDYDKSNINISDLYSEDQKKCTFIHECLHGIDDIMEINLDEDQIRKLGKGLYQFIKDNPGIFNEKSECNMEEIGKCVAEKMKEALINIKS
ncbi:hypothetical protein CLPUN_46120 [Clostridium puniceum]|uniref:Phage protein n=1 Tax=Clostridium puniceum TaxID=29367 RepID=A0A1S8T5I5_9CLOT|nr:hypothetical protein [Clostridium puniceum]OOM72909.1 hypothetical protein CLPUN_46120 [Clostridium puniceum]